MSDIAMLMTGVLMTKQPASPNALNLPVIQIEKSMQKSIQGQSSQLLAQAQAASPRTTLPNDPFSRLPLARKSKSQKSRLTKVKQILAKDIDKLTKLSAVHSLKDKFSARKSLITQQRRDRLIFQKLQKVSFLNRQRLTSEQNSGDIFVASSQSFANHTLPNLGFRSSGVAVKVLQRLLMANGYRVGVDGNFGALTESAVKAFQAQHDLRVDGVVGAKTWQYLAMYSQ